MTRPRCTNGNSITPRLCPPIAALGLLAWCAGSALAQTPIFSKAGGSASDTGVSTGPLTRSGVAAPSGWTWSEVSGTTLDTARALGGLSSQIASSPDVYRVADWFVVPTGRRFLIDQAVVFAYQPGTATAPFGAMSVRIWAGAPGDAGSRVVFGSQTPGPLASITSASAYRVFTTSIPAAGVVPDTARPIWKLTGATPALWLEPGTYWLDVQIAPTDVTGEAFVPSVILAGPAAVNVPARQLLPGLPAPLWMPVIDPGQTPLALPANVSIPFQLVGQNIVRCVADFPAPGQRPSGTVSVQSVFNFLTAWFSSDPRADINRDGQVAVQDVFDFLTAWFSGC